MNGVSLARAHAPAYFSFTENLFSISPAFFTCKNRFSEGSTDPNEGVFPNWSTIGTPTMIGLVGTGPHSELRHRKVVAILDVLRMASKRGILSYDITSYTMPRVSCVGSTASVPPPLSVFPGRSLHLPTDRSLVGCP